MSTGDAMNEYAVTLPNGFETVMQLSEEDAKRLGAKAVKPANKAVTPQNKEAAGDDAKPAAPARKRN